jgi:hypothetical protein
MKTPSAVVINLMYEKTVGMAEQLLMPDEAG